MRLKKIALIGSAVAALGLPVLASADLVTVNNTNEFSSVRIQQTGICPTRTTAPHGSLPTAIGTVRTICGNPLKKTGDCTATVFASSDCSGAPVATVTIDLANLNIKAINNLSGSYAVSSPAFSTVQIDYR